ncbi:unnamed protein product, partial [Urochloa humidicola]
RSQRSHSATPLSLSPSRQTRQVGRRLLRRRRGGAVLPSLLGAGRPGTPHSRVWFGARPAMDVMHDDALGLVLERVDSHVSLIRAAAVCRRWRRAITDAAFLRRYRSLHAPAVAGE